MMKTEIRQALQTLENEFGKGIFGNPRQFKGALADAAAGAEGKRVRHLLGVAVCDMKAYTRMEAGLAGNPFMVDNLAAEMASDYMIDKAAARMAIECVAEMLGHRPTAKKPGASQAAPNPAEAPAAGGSPQLDVSKLLSDPAFIQGIAQSLGLKGSPPQPVPAPSPAPAPVSPPKAPFLKPFFQAPASAAPPGFVRVEGGTFLMGSPAGTPDSFDNERPVRSVTVSGFWMCRHPVTQKEWAEVMGSNPSRFKGDERPVESVSWHDAVEYANKRSQREGLAPAYAGSDRNVVWNRGADGYRLPTEAEWEYAVRGGHGSPGNYAYSGSNNIDEVAWYTHNSVGSTRPVCQKKPNVLGLYDMSGNVREWCWDWRGSYPSVAQTDPAGAFSGSSRALRGGGWDSSAAGVRCACRGRNEPSTRFGSIGFRLVRL